MSAVSSTPRGTLLAAAQSLRRLFPESARELLARMVVKARTLVQPQRPQAVVLRQLAEHLVQSAEEGGWWGGVDEQLTRWVRRYDSIVRPILARAGPRAEEAYAEYLRAVVSRWDKVRNGVRPRPVPGSGPPDLPYAALLRTYARNAVRAQFKREDAPEIGMEMPEELPDVRPMVGVEEDEALAILRLRLDLFLHEDLTPGEREVLVLHLQGVPVQEIAVILDVSENAVSQKLNSVRTRAIARGIAPFSAGEPT